MKKNIKAKGSVLILTLLLSSVLFAIGISFTFIIENEVRRQNFSEEALKAFLIADTAVECTLYNDFRLLAFSFRGEGSSDINFSCGPNLIAIPKIDPEKAEDWNMRLSIGKIRASRDEIGKEGGHVEGRPGLVLEELGVSYNYIITEENGNVDLRRPCAEVSVRKKCGGIENDRCKDKSNIVSELEVLGYNYCSRGKRGEVVRRIIYQY